jgi:hypothetical protein
MSDLLMLRAGEVEATFAFENHGRSLMRAVMHDDQSVSIERPPGHEGTPEDDRSKVLLGSHSGDDPPVAAEVAVDSARHPAAEAFVHESQTVDRR